MLEFMENRGITPGMSEGARMEHLEHIMQQDLPSRVTRNLFQLVGRAQPGPVVFANDELKSCGDLVERRGADRYRDDMNHCDDDLLEIYSGDELYCDNASSDPGDDDQWGTDGPPPASAISDDDYDESLLDYYSD